MEYNGGIIGGDISSHMQMRGKEMFSPLLLAAVYMDASNSNLLTAKYRMFICICYSSFICKCGS
jgi:hypothetical protein